MTCSHPRPRPFLRGLAGMILGFAIVAMAAGCGPTVQRVGDPVVPPRPDLSTPEAALRSYLDWTTLAYRLANSDIASKAVEPYELVRVDSYIALNRQQENKGMERRLTAFKVRGESVDGTHTLLATSETWRYRYFSLADLAYVSPEYSTSYEATYTVGRFPELGGWLVMDVEAKALDAVH